MMNLVHTLLKMRVRPYYLYQCDPISGSSHFRTTVEKGLEIIKGLRGFTSGYAIPTYVIDAPGGGGKIPIMPDYVVGRDEKDLILRNYNGEIFRYPDHNSENCFSSTIVTPRRTKPDNVRITMTAKRTIGKGQPASVSLTEKGRGEDPFSCRQHGNDRLSPAG
jgi:hypothetical protein